MYKYIIKRSLLAIPTLLGVSMIIFGMLYLAPGGPVEVMMSSQPASAEQIQDIRQQLNLDEPIYVQYGDWAWDALHGELGRSWSITQGTAVNDLIIQRIPLTAELALLSMILAIAIGIPAGIIGAVYQDQIADHAARVVALSGISIPDFWLGIMLIVVFGVQFQISWASGSWIPLSESVTGNLKHLIFPVITLGTAYSGLIARMMRSEMLDALNGGYIRTAQAMGISNRTIVFRDAAKNAFIPVLTVIGIGLARLMNGALLTETVFNLPGIGQLLVTSIARRDYRVIQGIVLFVAVIFIVSNIIVDVLYAYLDPRIRLSGGD
ncbi:ABC transporter permease [Halococcus thailandensis]